MEYHRVYEALWIEPSFSEMLDKASTNKLQPGNPYFIFVKIAHVEGDPAGFAAS